MLAAVDVELINGRLIKGMCLVCFFYQTTCGLNHTRGKLSRSELCLLSAVCAVGGGSVISHLCD